MALFQQTTAIIKLDLWMYEITYLFAYAISATAAMTDLAKYETK